MQRYTQTGYQVDITQVALFLIIIFTVLGEIIELCTFIFSGNIPTGFELVFEVLLYRRLVFKHLSGHRIHRNLHPDSKFCQREEYLFDPLHWPVGKRSPRSPHISPFQLVVVVLLLLNTLVIFYCCFFPFSSVANDVFITTRLTFWKREQKCKLVRYL